MSRLRLPLIVLFILNLGFWRLGSMLLLCAPESLSFLGGIKSIYWGLLGSKSSRAHFCIIWRKSVIVDEAKSPIAPRFIAAAFASVSSCVVKKIVRSFFCWLMLPSTLSALKLPTFPCVMLSLRIDVFGSRAGALLMLPCLRVWFFRNAATSLAMLF